MVLLRLLRQCRLQAPVPQRSTARYSESQMTSTR